MENIGLLKSLCILAITHVTNFCIREGVEASRKAFWTPAFEREESSAANRPRVSAPLVRMPWMIT